MKGYIISNGYMGYVDGEYMLFATEEEYYEYISESMSDAAPAARRDRASAEAGATSMAWARWPGSR